MAAQSTAEIPSIDLGKSVQTNGAASMSTESYRYLLVNVLLALCVACSSGGDTSSERSDDPVFLPAYVKLHDQTWRALERFCADKDQWQFLCAGGWHVQPTFVSVGDRTANGDSIVDILIEYEIKPVTDGAKEIAAQIHLDKMSGGFSAASVNSAGGVNYNLFYWPTPLRIEEKSNEAALIDRTREEVVRKLEGKLGPTVWKSRNTFQKYIGRAIPSNLDEAALKYGGLPDENGRGIALFPFNSPKPLIAPDLHAYKIVGDIVRIDRGMILIAIHGASILTAALRMTEGSILDKSSGIEGAKTVIAIGRYVEKRESFSQSNFSPEMPVLDVLFAHLE